MNNPLVEYFQCPEQLARFEPSGPLSGEMGFFQFAPETICFGQYFGGKPAERRSGALPDAIQATSFDGDVVRLPFDLPQVVDNLRFERYCAGSHQLTNGAAKTPLSTKLYYLLRPVLGVHVRRYFQRIHLRGWDRIDFPRWPVDLSVDSLLESVVELSLKGSGAKELPFIWFWPAGAQSCVMMTHDVEGPAGRDFCRQLMDIDESFHVKSAFQIVPETRYENTDSLFDDIRKRGFEVNVHDLNHDGMLFKDKQQFSQRAERINSYAKKFLTRGFRSGSMYRRQDWYDAFDISYDMSVPNVAHLEPQRGGCCTVMPYFVGSILELPLTTIQDYSLFHILGDYSIDVWKEQIKIIRARNGFISFIVHPDYIIEKKARSVYVKLLEYLASIREAENLWIALPVEIDKWWRNRSQMKLVQHGSDWKIEGPDADRAKVAYAYLQNGRLKYRLAD
jgi:hypothetical protein